MNIETKDIEEFKMLLVFELVKKYNISKYKAESIVRTSTVSILLEEFPQFIMHYNVEYTVEEIWSEYTECKTNMK